VFSLLSQDHDILKSKSVERAGKPAPKKRQGKKSLMPDLRGHNSDIFSGKEGLSGESSSLLEVGGGAVGEMSQGMWKEGSTREGGKPLQVSARKRSRAPG